MPLKYSDFEMCLYEGYIRNRKQLLRELSLIEAADPIVTDKEIIIHAYPPLPRGGGPPAPARSGGH